MNTTPTLESTPTVQHQRRCVGLCAEQHRLIGFADWVLSNWGRTIRLLVAATVLIAALTVALWLLPIDLHLGSVHLTRPTPH